jgi:protein-tyrosine phosphatase
MKNNADQVAKNLWVGGVPVDPEEVNENFDALVLAAREFQDVFPAHKFPGTVVIYSPIPDDKLTNAEKAIALRAAIQVYELNRDGRRVLVTCAQGVNRSALIAALAMLIGGWSVRKAVGNIRKYRKPPSGSTPLFNVHFINFLEALQDAFSETRSRTDSQKPEREARTPSSASAG